MSLAFVACITGTEDSGADATVATSSGTLNVAAGDLLVAFVKTEDAAVTLSSVTDGGSNSLTVGTTVNNGGHPYACFGWKLAASANATAAFTATWSGNGSYKRILVIQFRPDAGESVSLDPAASNPALATGTSASPASGAIDGAGTDGVHIGGFAEYDIFLWEPPANNPKIGTVECQTRVYSAAEHTFLWYNLYTSDPGSVTANGAGNISCAWVCGIIGFNSAAAGGGTLSVVASECE